MFLVVTFLLLPEIPSWRLSEGHPQELEVLLLVPRLAALPPDPAEPLQLHLDLGRDERSAEEQCPHRAPLHRDLGSTGHWCTLRSDAISVAGHTGESGPSLHSPPPAGVLCTAGWAGPARAATLQMQKLVLVLRRWGPHVLGWPLGRTLDMGDKGVRQVPERVSFVYINHHHIILLDHKF